MRIHVAKVQRKHLETVGNRVRNAALKCVLFGADGKW